MYKTSLLPMKGQALVLGRVAPKLAVAAPRMLVQPVRAAAEGPAATPSPAAATAEGEKPLKMNRADSWKLAYDRLKNREIHEYKVLSFNKGGLMIKLGEAKGFVPYSYLDPKRFPGGKTPHPDVMDMIATALVGTTMKLRIIRCDVPNKDMVLSERDVLIDAAIKSFVPGEEKDVIVKSNNTDFGVFVSVLDSNGKSTGVDGLIRKGELSWNRVNDPSDVVKVGQKLRVKVLKVDEEKNKLYFSLKAMSQDPLLETLEEVLPMSELSDAVWRTAQEPLEGMDVIIRELLAEQGITGVTLGRQAEEKKTVTQDLEVYMTNAKVEDGYNLVARAGRLVQEVHVSTRLSRDEMKRALQRVLKKL